MTNIFKSQNLDSDFDKYREALIKTNSIKYPIDETNISVIKKYHRLTYLIALIGAKVERKYKVDNKYLYLNEILSDSLSNSSLFVVGYFHSSQIISRRIIENFYNHIFYFDHPVEFELLNLGKNEYKPILELKDYFEFHPYVRKLEDGNIKIFNNQLFNHYQELCKVVHSKGHKFMSLAKTLVEIKPDFHFTNHIIQINKTLSSINYLLFKFHQELTFTPVEKDLIAKTFAKSLRGSLFS